MSWALVLFLCGRFACQPVVAADGLTSQSACMITGALLAPQAPGRVKRMVCVESSKLKAYLGSYQA